MTSVFRALDSVGFGRDDWAKPQAYWANTSRILRLRSDRRRPAIWR